jgi:hypothetical protein
MSALSSTQPQRSSRSSSLPGAQAFGARPPALMQMSAFALHAGMTTSQAGDAQFVFPGIPEALWYAVRPTPATDPDPGWRRWRARPGPQAPGTSPVRVAAQTGRCGVRCTRRRAMGGGHSALPKPVTARVRKTIANRHVMPMSAAMGSV